MTDAPRYQLTVTLPGGQVVQPPPYDFRFAADMAAAEWARKVPGAQTQVVEVQQPGQQA